jgi:hypothetical protein
MSTSTLRQLSRLLAALRKIRSETAELTERQDLLNRPWAEKFLHWAQDGTLHGRLAPPSRHFRSTTRSGWCPGLRQ